MMQRCLFFLFICQMLLSCTHHYLLKESTSSLEVAELNDLIFNRKSEIELTNQKVIQVYDLKIVPPNVIFMPLNEDKRDTLLISDIRKIVLIDRKRGKIEGLKKGFLFGATVGFIIGLPVGVFAEESALEVAILGGGIVGIQWGIIGFTLGATRGAEDRITVSSSEN